MRRNLFLYLAVVCFFGLVAIFIVDGYMGIYDTVRVTAEEHEQIMEPDQWSRQYYEPSVRTTWQGKVFFSYEVANRRFSQYETPIQASVWQENKKLFDLFYEEKSIEPFDQVTVEWALDSSELESRGFSEGQYTVKIERNGVERKVIIRYYTPTEKLSPPIPVPAR